MASLCCSIDRCMSSVTLHMDLEPWQIGNGWQLATYCCWSASCRAALSNASEGRPACRGPDCWSRMTPTWPPLAAGRGPGMHWPPHSTPLHSQFPSSANIPTAVRVAVQYGPAPSPAWPGDGDWQPHDPSVCARPAGRERSGRSAFHLAVTCIGSQASMEARAGGHVRACPSSSGQGARCWACAAYTRRQDFCNGPHAGHLLAWSGALWNSGHQSICCCWPGPCRLLCHRLHLSDCPPIYRVVYFLTIILLLLNCLLYTQIK
jgi:hypothetical protein